jgi:hypothetical protein
MVGWLTNNQPGRIHNKVSVALLKSYPVIWLKELRKTVTNVTWDDWFTGPDFNGHLQNTNLKHYHYSNLLCNAIK